MAGQTVCCVSLVQLRWIHISTAQAGKVRPKPAPSHLTMWSLLTCQWPDKNLEMTWESRRFHLSQYCAWYIHIPVATMLKAVSQPSSLSRTLCICVCVCVACFYASCIAKSMSNISLWIMYVYVCLCCYVWFLQICFAITRIGGPPNGTVKSCRCGYSINDALFRSALSKTYRTNASCHVLIRMETLETWAYDVRKNTPRYQRKNSDCAQKRIHLLCLSLLQFPPVVKSGS